MEIWPIRQVVLDGSIGISEQNIRNEPAYRGNIMADIELIDFMGKLDPMRADLWEATFQDLYLIHFYSKSLATAESVEIFNIYATIRFVRPWSADTSASHASAVAQCKQLVGAATGRQDGYWMEAMTIWLK